MSTPVEVAVRGKGFEALDRKWRGTGDAAERMSRRTVANMAQVQKAAGWVQSSAGTMYAALGGAGAIASTKAILDYRQVMGQLQADLGYSTEKIEALSKEVLATADAYNIAEDKITAALQVWQDQGGIVEKARGNLDKVAMTAKATGADIEDIATIYGAALKTLGMTPDQAVRGLAQLTKQSVAGEVALRGLARVLPGVLAAGANLGFKGSRGIEQMGTALQVAGQLTAGSAEESRTLVMALLNELVAQSGKLKKKFGIRVLNKDGTMKDLDAIMAAIAKKTGGRVDKMQKIFSSQEALKLAGGYAAQVDQETGKYKEGTGQTVAAVSKAGKEAVFADVEAQFRLRVGGIAKESEAVTGALRELKTGLLEHGGDMVKWASENKLAAGLAVAGGYGAIKIGAWALPKLMPKMMEGLLGLFGRKKGASGAPAAGSAGGLGGLAPIFQGKGGVLPVFVVNLPGANLGQAAQWFGRGGHNLPAGGDGASGAPGKVGKLAKVAGVLGPLATVFSSAFALGTAFDQLTGASDKLGPALWNLFGSADREASKKRVAEHETKTRYSGVSEQAQKLLEMRNRGLKQVDLGEGKSLNLGDQAAVSTYLREYSARVGQTSNETDAAMLALTPLIAQIAAPQQVQVEVSVKDDRAEVTGRGLNTPARIASRGPQAAP